MGNGTTYLWRIGDGQLITTLANQHSKGVDSVAFSPDGATLATGNRDSRHLLVARQHALTGSGYLSDAGY